MDRFATGFLVATIILSITICFTMIGILYTSFSRFMKIKRFRKEMNNFSANSKTHMGEKR